MTLSADQKYRLFIPLKEYPKQLVETLLFKEDQFFYYHLGVNPVSLARAAVTNLTQTKRLGASTITMQVARLKSNFSSRTLLGKLRQVYLALQLELTHSKDEILEAYLNLLPYGANIEGAGSASLIYFGKPVEKINLPEIFSLAVIPQSPSLRTIGARGEIQSSHELIQERNLLFQSWQKSHHVSDSELSQFEFPFEMKGIRDLPFLAPHFVEELLSNYSQQTQHLTSTLDLYTQKILEEKIKSFISRHHKVGVHNAAGMVVHVPSNEVRALVGSAHFFNDEIAGQVNGTLGKRSPGSTLKPLLYALAFDQGLIHSQSLLKDSPSSLGSYNPENFDGDYLGPILVENALNRSRNVPAVWVASQLKNPNFYEFLQKAGIKPAFPQEHYGMSYVLGGLELTMQEIVQLYSALANLGIYRPLKKLLRFDSHIEKPQTSAIQILSPEASHMTLDILGKTALPPSLPSSKWSRVPLKVAWKTGTSNAFRDAWTIGILGDYVIALWIGNFDGTPNPSFVGRDLAAPLFFEVAESLNSHFPKDVQAVRTLPTGLKKIEVCALSGGIPGPHCHTKKNAWFIPGKSPITKCEIHREISIDKISGLKACNPDSPTAKKVVFEYWPSDLMKLFSLAGTPRRVPPQLEPQCRDRNMIQLGASPNIVSPHSDLIYSIRAFQERPRIPFSVVTEPDVRENFWFLNGSFIGKSKASEPLFWQASAGRFEIRVVDDHGRFDKKNFSVEIVQ